MSKRTARKRGRVSRSADFDRIYRKGLSEANRYMVVYRFPRPDGSGSEPRLGISVSKRVGGAVQRNRVKRVVREAFWEDDKTARQPYDFVVVARNGLVGLLEREGIEGVKGSFNDLFARLSQRDAD